MYKETFAFVLTPEGENCHVQDWCSNRQRDLPLSFLFIMLFDYASNDGLTLKPRQSRRYPAEKLLDYAILLFLKNLLKQLKTY